MPVRGGRARHRQDRDAARGHPPDAHTRVAADASAPFRYIEINALRLASPQHAYVQLYRVNHACLLKHALPML